jgi:SAM-dependent methyltransferase
MEPASLFSELEVINERPTPFSVYSARDLWTNEHTSEQMLAYHLNGDVDISSRRTSTIDMSVSWMANRFNLPKNGKVIDFGCGPGLYTSRLAKLGAEVCGVDFSSRSIDYAREQAALDSLTITYIEADYLELQPKGPFDLVTMIMCDFCALGPTQRAAMLKKFRDIVSNDGRIVFDVYSLKAFEAKLEASVYEKNLMNGFWSADPYFGFVTSLKYDDDQVSLDKYTIIERKRRWETYNWLQYFSPESLQNELHAAGLETEETLRDVAGHSYDADHTEFALVAKRC